MPFPARPIAQRLAGRLKANVETGCIEYTGFRDREGYGMIQADGGARALRAHRVAFELARGAVPAGLVLDHLCRNTSCCNPDHLEPVTGRENTLRGMSVVGQNARKRFCKHGHEFTPENTYQRPGGGRRCRACAYTPKRTRPIP